MITSWDFHSSNHTPLDVSSILKAELSLIIAPISYDSTTIPIKAGNEAIDVEALIKRSNDRVQLAYIELNDSKIHLVVSKHREDSHFIHFPPNFLSSLSFRHWGIYVSEVSYFRPCNLKHSFKQEWSVIVVRLDEIQDLTSKIAWHYSKAALLSMSAWCHTLRWWITPIRWWMINQVHSLVMKRITCISKLPIRMSA